MPSDKTLYDEQLSDQPSFAQMLEPEAAARLFRFFRDCPLFRWQDANNDCEDRADAACRLLDNWGIPNCKGWVFSGQYLQRGEGNLTNCWNYHVAACVPIGGPERVSIAVIDPATLSTCDDIANWAGNITSTAFSYHMVKTGSLYIFRPPVASVEDWHPRDRQNYKWTMQGLAGINGVTRTGKAQLVFQKNRVARTERAFRKLLTGPSPI
jgi:hypothetical protein